MIWDETAGKVVGKCTTIESEMIETVAQSSITMSTRFLLCDTYMHVLKSLGVLALMNKSAICAAELGEGEKTL